MYPPNKTLLWEINENLMCGDQKGHIIVKSETELSEQTNILGHLPER